MTCGTLFIMSIIIILIFYMKVQFQKISTLTLQKGLELSEGRGLSKTKKVKKMLEA